jgi:hypothetical protein
MHSIVLSYEQVVGIFAAFKPNTIDAGLDAEFAGQRASCYTQRTGTIEHLTCNDVPEIMTIINGPDARGEKIGDPMRYR